MNDNPINILSSGTPTFISAPMVRYSKLAFRKLVRRYGVDIAYTPMIMSDAFWQSSSARQVDFCTNSSDRPLIVQFGASNAVDLVNSSEIIAPFVNGIDLNCGCPQKWAYKEKIGCYLSENPEIVQDMVRSVKQRTSGYHLWKENELGHTAGIPISIKIRLSKDMKKSVELVQRAQQVGVDFITIHGRNRLQRTSEPCDFKAIKLLKEHCQVPVVANGDIFTLQDGYDVLEQTKVNGVMAARGLLQNPAMFHPEPIDPFNIAKEYLDLAVSLGTNDYIARHHLMYILEGSLSRAEKRTFNCLTSIPAMIDYFEEL